MSGNEEQQAYWNGRAGAVWVEAQERLDENFAELTSAVVAAADVQPGERAIDIGCGCGATTVALAQAGAAVWGVDISAPMIGRAKERSVGLDNVAYSVCDAASQRYTPDHDLLFSRFGCMFFADPVGAYQNLLTSLRPGGRLVHLVWQLPKHNPWMSVVGRAVQPFMPEGDAPDPTAPGPFAFARPEHVEKILTDAGFANVNVQPVTSQIKVGNDIEDAVTMQSKVGPIARVVAELDEVTKVKALDAARDALAEHLTDEGIHLGAACWIISASNEN